jgi:rhamnopyranosyl-N-acetylglucosaminyl-diphospho-decaprenol beta-1,3/1,4-galactofuranosyltransferase
MRVHAVVTTYNRKALLLECLAALERQTHPVERLFLIDNASTDGTPEALRELGVPGRDDVNYLRSPENVGGSGGFARGVRAAREADSDWIWFMDDDAQPAPDAAEALLAAPPASDERVVALCPKVVQPDGSVDTVMRGHFRRRLRHLPPGAYEPGGYPAIGYTSFVGPMVRTEAARAVDPPREDFFVWGDDLEYSLRLRREGELRLVPEAVVVHDAPSRSYTNARSRFWNRLLPVQMYPTPLERFWQSLCGYRNYIWVKREYERQSALSAVGTTAQFMVKALLYDDQPLRRLPWIVRFARQGRRGRFDNIPPERWAEMVRAGDV